MSAMTCVRCLSARNNSTAAEVEKQHAEVMNQLQQEGIEGGSYFTAEEASQIVDMHTHMPLY